MSLKERIEQRRKDLVGNKSQRQALVDVEAARLVLEDLTMAAEIAGEVAAIANVDVEGAAAVVSIEDIVTVNQLVQAYIPAAHQRLIMAGEIEPPAVQTTPAAAVKTKEDLVS